MVRGYLLYLNDNCVTNACVQVSRYDFAPAIDPLAMQR